MVSLGSGCPRVDVTSFVSGDEHDTLVTQTVTRTVSIRLSGNTPTNLLDEAAWGYRPDGTGGSPLSFHDPSDGTRWRLTASLGLVVGVGTVVRLSLLDHVLRNDEVVTATRHGVDLVTALTDYSAPNNHILHTVLVNLSTSLFGWDPWAIRLPAFLFGIGLIIAVDWWISSATGRRTAGLLAAAFVAGSSMLIEYSTLARGYSMLAVAFVVLLELSRRLLQGSSLRLWVGWIAVATAGLATVPVFVFPLATVGVWFVVTGVIRHRRRDLLGQLALSVLVVGALTVLAYLPAVITTGLDAILDNPFVRPLTWSQLPGDWYRLTANLAVLVWRDGIAAIVYSLLFITAVALNRRIFGSPPTPVIGLLGPLALVIGRQVAPPQRVWLFVWPLVLGMAGAGLAYLIDRFSPRFASHRVAIPILALLIASTMGVATLVSGDVQESREGGAFHDAPDVAELLMGELEERDRVLVNSHPRWVLDYYLSPDVRSDPAMARDFDNAQRVFVVVYHPRPQTLEGVLADSSFPENEFSDPTLMWSLPETDVYVTERAD